MVTYDAVETAGAVSTPVLEIEPALVDHTTAVLLVPLTLAENCCFPPDGTVALKGFTLTAIFCVLAAVTVTLAEALAVVNAALVAVTVTFDVVETIGAVSTPVLEMEPAVVAQMTDVLLDPITVATNCCVPPEASVELLGDT